MDVNDQRARLVYIQWQDHYKIERPYIITSAHYQGDIPRTNVVLSKNIEEEIIHDARGQESSFELDTHGFTFRHLKGAEAGFKDFYNKEAVEQSFIPDTVVPFLKKHVEGAGRIVVFDWHLRCSDPARVPEYQDLKDGTQPYAPAEHVHIDQSAVAAVRRVRRHLGSEAGEVLRGRLRIVNFWKPLFEKVTTSPLAMCDGATVNKEDCVSVELVNFGSSSEYTGDTIMLLPSKAYRWYFLREQEPNEVILMKIFDSDRRCAARCCPHTAFQPTQGLSGQTPRQSIEVRALVFSRT